jgi:hypothetical protein
VEGVVEEFVELVIFILDRLAFKVGVFASDVGGVGDVNIEGLFGVESMEVVSKACLLFFAGFNSRGAQGRVIFVNANINFSSATDDFDVVLAFEFLGTL